MSDETTTATDEPGDNPPTVTSNPSFVAPVPPGKQPKKPVVRKPGEVRAGDFIELRRGRWFHCAEPGDVELDRDTSAIAVALESMGYDPDRGTERIANIPVAQFWQDATRSPYRHSRKEVAEAMRRYKIDQATIQATMNRLPPDPVAE